MNSYDVVEYVIADKERILIFLRIRAVDENIVANEVRKESDKL